MSHLPVYKREKNILQFVFFIDTNSILQFFFLHRMSTQKKIASSQLY